MFSIGFTSPPAVDEHGWPHASGALLVGGARSGFTVDLGHWRIGDYQRQWRAGIARLARDATSTALMTAFRGPGDSAHAMWALWKDTGHVYVQELLVLQSELDAPFNPRQPYGHVGEHVPTSLGGLPIPEWRTELKDLYAAMQETRNPKYSWFIGGADGSTR
jgi:hypothetical protein